MTKWLQAIQTEHDLSRGRGHRHYLGRHLSARRPGARKRLPGCGAPRRQSRPSFWSNISSGSFSSPTARCWSCAAPIERSPQNFDVADWVARTQSHNNLTAQFGIAGADGFVKQSSLGPLPAPVYVGDRTPFYVQRDSKIDRLYISDPVIGHVTKKITLRIYAALEQSRRIVCRYRRMLARHC